MSVKSSIPGDARPWYQRKRTYAALMIASLVLGVVALLIAIRVAPGKVVQKALGMANAPVSIRQVEWEKDGALSLRGIRMGKGAKDESSENVYFSAGRITVRWSWPELLIGGRVASVELRKPQIWVSRLNKAFGGNGNGNSRNGDAASSRNWSISSLRIFNGTLMIDNLGTDIPPVPITIGKEKEVEFRNVQLAGQGAGMDREETATVEKLLITSPYDPMSPVLYFQAINVTFTWEELRRSQIRKVDLVGPVIYLGPDLFWFADRFSQQRAKPDDGKASTPAAASVPAAAVDTSAPWRIGEFNVRAGQLAVNAFGQAGVTLPFTFVSSARDIRLDQLDKISITNKIIIPSQDRFYPEYKIRWQDMSGEIAFSLPLGAANADNVVNTIHVKSISWNDIAVTDAWSSVTFDRNGIYGRMEGHCYEGYLAADFSVLFANGYPWQGHFFVQKVNSSPIATKLAPAYLSLTGILNGNLSVNGKATEIVKTAGELKLEPPGVMEIKSIDDLVKKLPADWNFAKRDLVTILLESFRTYNYTRGELSLDYQNPTAVGALRLSGLQGERNFTVRWHQDQQPEVANSPTKR